MFRRKDICLGEISSIDGKIYNLINYIRRKLYNFMIKLTLPEVFFIRFNELNSEFLNHILRVFRLKFEANRSRG